MNRPVLTPGDRGKAVLAARKRLEQRGYDTPHDHSEFYGQGLTRAVTAFQRHAGLTVDAVIGPKTWAALTHKPNGNPGPVTTAVAMALTMKRRMTGRDGHPRPNYRLGYEINLTDKYPTTADCSEAVQWAVYQTVKDTFVDGSYNQYPACRPISVAKARETVGALVFLTDDNTPTGTIHHVGVVCEEKGKPVVAQARSAFLTPNCGIWDFDDQPWILAGLVRELSYK